MHASLAARGAEQIVPQLLPTLAVLLVLVVVAAVVLVVLRRVVRSDDDRPEPEGFTLHSLREMHARGELSDEEWERAKAVIIGRAKLDDGSGDGSGDGLGANDEAEEPPSPDNRADDEA